MKCSIIIPVYNERETIRSLLERVQAVKLDKEIIVVDDCSVDGTAEVLATLNGIRVIRHTENRGKGAALLTGLKHVTGEIFIPQDADLEYDPSEIPKLVEKIKNGSEVVYGSRFKGGGRFLLISFLANKFLVSLTNLLYGSRLTDMETCYKCMRTEVVRSLNLQAQKFDFETEITAKILKQGYKIEEVPISYYGRREGKKVGWKDGLQAVWSLLRYRFSG